MYWITGILGLAFAAAPFVLGYTDNTIATWTSLILGAAVMIDSYIEALSEGKDKWEYWTATVIGIGAVVAPFILGFGAHMTAMWTSVSVGVLLAIVAGYQLFSDQPHYG